MKDGGPAFPKTEYYSDTDIPFNQTSGMSLRDYFAAAAMQGMISSANEDFDDSSDECARKAYKYADAMLEARK
jgi:hypothetical protein